VDPDANLEEQRRIQERLDRSRLDDYPSDTILELQNNDLNRLAQLAAALDEWLSRGGFLPKAWLR
jgi:hypothetical protein